MTRSKLVCWAFGHAFEVTRVVRTRRARFITATKGGVLSEALETCRRCGAVRIVLR